MRFPLYVIVIITDILTAALFCLSAIISGMPIDEVYSSLPFFLLVGLIGSMYYAAFMATDPFTRIFFYSAGVSYILFGYNFNGTLLIYGYAPYSGGIPTSLGAILASVIPAAVITGLSYACYRIYEVLRKSVSRRQEKKVAQEAALHAKKAKAKKRGDYQQEILSFSNGRPVDIVLIINKNHETSKYLERNKTYIDEKMDAYGSVLNGGAVRSAGIDRAIVDCICNTIKNELRLRDEAGVDKRIYFIVYTTGFDYYSEEFTSGHLRNLVKRAEEKDCKFRFVLDGPDSYTLSSERNGMCSFVESWIVHEYIEWKNKYPDHLIIVSDAESWGNDAVAFEKGAVVLNALLYGDRNVVCDAQYNDVKPSSPSIDELEPLFQNSSDTNEGNLAIQNEHQGLKIIIGDPLAVYRNNKHIAKIATSSRVVIPTLNMYRINYVLVKDNMLIEKKDFGDNYEKFPGSLFPKYRFDEKDFHEAYILSGVRKYRYYDGKRWDNADNVVMKKKSHWVSMFPDAVVIEIKSNRVDASVDILSDASKYVLDALTERGWGNEHRRNAFWAANILENAKVDYVVIHSGKVELENRFHGGKERYLRYLEAGRIGKHIPQVSLKLKRSIYHWEASKKYDDVIRDLEERVNNTAEENPDHVIAHAMSKFRKNEAPDLAIKLFNRYAELAGDHMLVSVAAAYGDIRLFDKAMYYIEQAQDGDYKDITKNRIIRNRRDFT